MKRHRHYYRHFSSTGGWGKNMVVMERCRCGEQRERRGTLEERREAAKSWRESGLIHKTWHALTKRFYDEKEQKWKLKAHALIVAIRKWVVRYPEVKIVRVDDGYFCGSELVLVPHALPDKYMGTTALFIPQCTGEEPIQLFLYPNHHRNLQKALAEIKREHGKKKGWRDR